MKQAPRSMATWLAISTFHTALAGGPQLMSGSAVTSGMSRALPIASLSGATDVAAGGSVTAIRTTDKLWLGIGSDAIGVIRDLPSDACTIALGNAHGIAITGPNQIRTWGDIDRSLESISPADSWDGVAAGGAHVAAWTKTGNLHMRGRNDLQQCTPPSDDGWKTISLGGSHSLGARIGGGVRAWGANTSMQCAVPQDVWRDAAVTSLAGGLLHSAAVTVEGRLYGWGSNAQGQIAFGPNGQSDARVWTDVCAGALHTVAIDQAGFVQAWGDDRFQQCSLDGWGVRTRSNVAKISAGLYHTVLLDRPKNGSAGVSELSIAGSNLSGEAGTPSEALADLACGDGFVVALRHDRSITVWGGQNDSIRRPPSGSFAVCAAGPQHAGAIDIAGYLFMWGNSADYRTTPPEIGTTERWTRLACGTKHSVGLLNTGAVRAWGSNAVGQSSVPVGLMASAITAGPYFSGAVSTSGAPIIWGANPAGVLAPPANLSLREISAGSSHCVALRRDQTVTAWGDNAHGQAAVPTMTPALAVCASESISGALLTDGSVRFWGAYQDGSQQWRQASAPDLPPRTSDSRPLRAHRISSGGGIMAVLVGHEYRASYTSGPYWTIQDAIDAAPVGAVVTVAPGKWSPEQIRADKTGLVLKGDIVLTAEHPSADYDPEGYRKDPKATILEGTLGFGSTRTTGSIITVWSNESPACVIQGFKFYLAQRGRVWPENPGCVVGGAIYVGQNARAEFCEGAQYVGPSPTIKDCFFDQCFSGYGGAIFLSRCKATISNCVFHRCEAQTSGGALYGWAFNGTISDCTFQFNKASDKDGGAAAMVTVSDSFQWCSAVCKPVNPSMNPTQASCEQIESTCDRRYDRGAPVFNRCDFIENAAYAYGGAIAYALGYRHPDALGPDGRRIQNMQCHDCVFSGNHANNGGGGICVSKPDVSSITGESCPYVSPSGIELRQCRAIDNQSANPGTQRMADLQGDWVDLGDNRIDRVGSPCRFDIDDSGAVDSSDLAITMMLFGTSVFVDFDDSGLVDYGDVNLLLMNLGPCS